MQNRVFGKTGTLRAVSAWPEGDSRNISFAGDKLRERVEGAERLRKH